MVRRTLLALLSVLLILPTASAADPWHLPGWQARAVVEIPKPSTETGVDTAGVRILCQGKAKADGSDYRVLDAGGKPLPFQLMFHDAERYSLLSFRALRRTLADKPSLEMRRRIEDLLRHLAKTPSVETLRSLRAIAVLEHIGTPEARQIVQGLARGAPAARETQAAEGALRRLLH